MKHFEINWKPFLCGCQEIFLIFLKVRFFDRFVYSFWCFCYEPRCWFVILLCGAFWKIWNGGGCNSKTAAKMAVARIKLLRNKREAVMRQMRRDIALLLQSGQDATARIRVFKKCCLCLFLYHILGSIVQVCVFLFILCNLWWWGIEFKGWINVFLKWHLNMEHNVFCKIFIFWFQVAHNPIPSLFLRLLLWSYGCGVNWSYQGLSSFSFHVISNKKPFHLAKSSLEFQLLVANVYGICSWCNCFWSRNHAKENSVW